MRKLLDGDLRLRTACDLEPIDGEKIVASRPENLTLSSLIDLEKGVKSAIEECKGLMVQTKVTFEDELKKAKDQKKKQADGNNDADDDEEDDNDTEPTDE